MKTLKPAGRKATLLFLVILIEGYVVLACELLAIRLLVPFVGSGTEIVAIAISAVLLPLAVGYHAGGRAFAARYARAKRLGTNRPSVRSLLLANVAMALLVLTPGLSYVFMESFFAAMQGQGIENRLLQTALYSLLFLVTPVFLLGQTVPLVSHYFARHRISEATGLILFFSTTGSFLGSVFSTLVLMGTIGVHNTVIVTLGLLALLALLLSRRRRPGPAALCAALFVIACLLNEGGALRERGIVSDNAYNTVAVEEIPEEAARILNINRSPSSKIAADPANDFPYLRYIRTHFIDPAIAAGTPRKILVIGAGGFTVGLRDDLNRYTYVDIDPSLRKTAEEHFLRSPLGPNKEFVAASARAFVRHDKGSYDLILIDAYTNIFAVPMETVTREFLVDVKSRLAPGGVVIANAIGSPTFADAFMVRYHNTFASVFPVHTRHIIGDFVGWPYPGEEKTIRNALYIYYDRPAVHDDIVYTDDKNTYSLDR